ncbi:DNA-binding transcriptional regulator, MarR family [Sinosporangium album]|uniref:DNA-binding transcriptional regulator, MarR family n=1 Tax=Sinosporangium album TaxID=504805 RepID=A0A1G7T918_9ACTN|nr:MarR family winged helix-turn-helix transcriptional regulator [Sinosporangium album]SDG31796.1 DNA-binding transcriptional regulator, MarR family [Sinosporangium album]
METTAGAVIDAALFRLRRMWARPLRPRRIGDAGRPVQMSNLMVVGAVRQLGHELPEVTVGAVAEYMDVDPSTASRLVNDAVGAGFVDREESQVDARRARLVPSAVGRRVLDAVSRYRRQHVDGLLADWSEEDRERFATLLARFAETSAARPPDLDRLDAVITEALSGEGDRASE